MYLKVKARGKGSFTHLPWYFGNILCIICEQRFKVKQKLFEHCETKGHQRKLDANKAPFDVQSERRQFVETERCAYSQVIIGFIEENFTEKEFFTNFDRPDGIIDRLDLFPESPKRVTMNTPELDSAPQDMVLCNGMLPMEFPCMPTSLGPIDPSTFAASMDEVVPQGGSSNATLSQRSIDVHPMVDELPDPPERPTKQARSQSAPVGPADDRLAAVVSKQQATEGKIDSLNKKVVDTAESQTADLKSRLSKLEECVKHNTTHNQGIGDCWSIGEGSRVTSVTGDAVSISDIVSGGNENVSVSISAQGCIDAPGAEGQIINFTYVIFHELI